MAILREQGINGHVEMAAALSLAGFEAIDLHMTDLLSGCIDLSSFNGLVACGGFSYGDYMRVGAIARFSPIMREVAAFAAQGRPLIGICNCFQVLCEAGLLPGVLLRNKSLKFICKDVLLRV